MLEGEPLQWSATSCERRRGSNTDEYRGSDTDSSDGGSTPPYLRRGRRSRRTASTSSRRKEETKGARWSASRGPASRGFVIRSQRPSPLACFKEPTCILMLLPDDLIVLCLMPLGPRATRRVRCAASWLRSHAVTVENSACWQATHFSLQRLLRQPQLVPAAIAQRIVGHPNECAETNAHGFLPLHEACVAPSSLESIEQAVAMLLHKHPSAASTQAPDGRLALHMLMEIGEPSSCLLQLLLKVAPEACATQDARGMLPLHHAVLRLSRHPASRRSWYPAEDVELVLQLLAAHGEAAATCDEHARFPLHLASAAHVPVNVLQALIKEFPLAPHLPDAEGWLPLHYAIKFGASDKLVELLLHENPAGMWACTSAGVRGPSRAPWQFPEAAAASSLRAAYLFCEMRWMELEQERHRQHRARGGTCNFIEEPFRPWRWGLQGSGLKVLGLNLLIHSASVLGAWLVLRHSSRLYELIILMCRLMGAEQYHEYDDGF